MTTDLIGRSPPEHPWIPATQSRAGAVHLLLPLRVASFSLSQALIMVSSTYEGSTSKPSAHSQHQERHTSYGCSRGPAHNSAPL